MSRPTVYRHLAQLAKVGQVIQVSPGPVARGHDRGRAAVNGSSHPVVSSHASRASARKRAYTHAETNAETKPGPPKNRTRPYDGRPRSGPGRTKQRNVRVVLPDQPPRLTPGATAALLRVLVKAHDRLTQAGSEQGETR